MARRADAKEKPRLGRPPKSGGAKRAHFTFRVDDDLKDWLTESASRSKWSVSEEIALLLHRCRDREGVVAELFGSPDARDLSEAVGLMLRHVDRLLTANPVALAKVNGKDKYGLDDALQASAAIIAFLQAINDMKASEIIDLASSVIERDPLIWREAAIAATAQALGSTLGNAAKKVDRGEAPPKAGFARVFDK